MAFAIAESISKHYKEFFMRQQLAAIQPGLLILQRDVSYSIAYSPASNAASSELDDDQHGANDLADPKEIMESDTEKEMGIME